MKLEWKENNNLLTEIIVNDKKVSIKNYTENILDRAFGINSLPDYNDFLKLLERRCFSETADGLKLRLEELGLTEYNRIEIIKRTNGILEKDNYSLSIVEE